MQILSTLLAVDFAPIIAPVLDVLNALLWPCIAIVGAVGMIYCIFLGIKIAKKTMRLVKENIVFSLAVKAVILVLGAVGIANMWLAIFADVGVALIATLNATRGLNTRNM